MNGSDFLTVARVVPRLGIFSVLSLLAYRVRLFLGLHRVQRAKPIKISGLFFTPNLNSSKKMLSPGTEASEKWPEEQDLFGWYKTRSMSPPKWGENPITKKTRDDHRKKWWHIPDFTADHDDIKAVWEISRFSWVVPFAQRAALGSTKDLNRLNDWMIDWYKQNPLPFGPNWRCAQEASLRLIHCLAGAMTLNPVALPTTSFHGFIRTHLDRVFFATAYARAQRNNHIISEAVALYCGGAFLQAQGLREGKKYQEKGKKLLERMLPRLVDEDGCFSQYSTNYHRLVVDLLSFCEVVRLKNGLPLFSEECRQALWRLTDWFQRTYYAPAKTMPNWGGNDGSKVLTFDDKDYRDFSSSLEISQTLFHGGGFGTESASGRYLDWLELQITHTEPITRALTPNRGKQPPVFPNLSIGTSKVYLRMPRFSFRPSNLDALHVDFWHGGVNLLRDAGSYSYSQELQGLADFHGNRGHNVVIFDGKDMMPQIGRVVYGGWPKPEPVPWKATNEPFIAGAVRDSAGNYHARKVQIAEGCLRVTDVIDGVFSRAVFRWRLQAGDWKLSNGLASLGGHRIKFGSDSQSLVASILEGRESLYYLKSDPVCILEISVLKPTTLNFSYEVLG